MTAAPDYGLIPEWTFGDRLRKIRRTLGIDQRAFAEQLGENPKTYAAWELDNTSPRDQVAVAKRIELLAGVPAAWTLAINTPPNGGPLATHPETRPSHRSISGTDHRYGQVIALTPRIRPERPSNGSPGTAPGRESATFTPTGGDRMQHHACAA